MQGQEIKEPEVPESKAVLKKKQNDEGVSKGHRSLKELPMAKLEQFEQQNNIVLDCNPKHKINIHESILL